jgi:streptogrisin C
VLESEEVILPITPPRRHRIRQLLGTVTAAALGLAIALAPATIAPAHSIRLADLSALDPSTMKESIQSLVMEYKVSEAEALRRLALQRTSALLDEQLLARFPDSYGGMWIDQAGGGILMIASTDPAGLGVVLQDLPDREHMKVVGVRHSRKVLQAAADRIMAVEGRVTMVTKAAGRPEVSFDVTATVDDMRNAVLVTGPRAAKYTASGLEHGHGLATGTVLVDTAWESITDDVCTIGSCTPPMRGGLRLDLYSSLSSSYTGFCTNGFNVHSSNGWQWTVTAGHCLTNANYTRHGNWVGAERWDTYVGDYYPYDGAVMPYVVSGGVNYAEYWLNGYAKNRVFYTGSTSMFPIYGMYTYDQIKVGWAACHTGAGFYGTKCGTVRSKDGGIRMNFTTQSGDSGGPLFSQVDNRAYAILKGHTSTDSYYSALSVLLNRAYATSGLTFSINTA